VTLCKARVRFTHLSTKLNGVSAAVAVCAQQVNALHNDLIPTGTLREIYHPDRQEARKQQ
jgi:hypothetical protein